jgi:hypothetical protein
MAHQAEKNAAEQLATPPGEGLHPFQPQGKGVVAPEMVNLGVGSRSSLVDQRPSPVPQFQSRGLLPVPPEVEAEVQRQEAKHPMTPEYRQKLRDRLTLAHYFSDVEVAFRRTPLGIDILAAGLNEIEAFRRTSTSEERQGVVYGVG